jgi:hypothetical protein
MPRWGDYAIVKAKPGSDVPEWAEVQIAGLFDENWQLQK